MSEVPLYLLSSCPHPVATLQGYLVHTRKVDVRLPRKENLNSHGARPVHLIIKTIMWIRTSRLSIKNSLFDLQQPIISEPAPDSGSAFF